MPKRQSITARRSNVIKQKRQLRTIKHDNELEMLHEKLKNKPQAQSISRKISKDSKIARIIKQKRQATARHVVDDAKPLVKKKPSKIKQEGKLLAKIARKSAQPKVKKRLTKKPQAQKLAPAKMPVRKKTKRQADKLKMAAPVKRSFQERKLSVKKATAQRKQKLKAKSKRQKDLKSL